MTRARTRTALGCALAVLAAALVALTGPAAPAAPTVASTVALHQDTDASILPPDFQDRLAIGNLSEPTAVAFAPPGPAEGTAFIALKSGEIKSFDYDAGSRVFEPFAAHTIFANLHVNVNNYWDRGLTGLTLDPQFGQNGHNFVYVNYAFNRDPRDNPPVVPKWDSGEGTYDGCLSPASMDPPTAGCIVSTRVARIPAVKQADGWVASGPEQPLFETACMQFPSHASGEVRFGPDGWLYASAGDGASFDAEDYGQGGNPCGDPANEGGSLRSQDYRTGGDPLGLGGTVYRINPANGLAPDGSNNNASRLVLYGQRNPWRLTFRPGTSELWSGDVGGSAWEEINRTDMASFGGPVNLGWPCYEGKVGGAVRQPAWDALDKPICEGLYGLGAGAVQAPAFAYQTRGPLLTPGEHCDSTTSSISGIAFAPTTGNYPDAYKGALFFSDFARGCIWRLGKKPDGSPDPNSIAPFVQHASTPVGIVPGPGGDLFYVDYGIVDGVVTPQAGGIHRITYQDPAPIAAISSNTTYGPLSQNYVFSAAGSADPNGRPLTYAWDLDGNGSFETDTGATPTASRTYGAAVNVTVSVRVTNNLGLSSTASLVIYPGNAAPSFGTVSPAPSFKWRVGQRVSFAASATDADQALPASAYTWSLGIRHCPKVCHTHPVDQWPSQQSGSFLAPDHEYPSHLLVSVSVTDARGLTVRKTTRIDPKTVKLTFATKPGRLRLAAGGVEDKAAFSKRFIVRGSLIVSAPKVQRRQGVTYKFRKWSDKGARSHGLVAPRKGETLTAYYRATKAVLRVRTTPGRLKVMVAGKNRTSGWEDNLKVGAKVWLAAPQTQTRKGEKWVFVRWSDGGGRIHRVVIGDTRMDLRAVYRKA